MRRFPRNVQSRADALAAPGHRFQHSERFKAGHKAEATRNFQTGTGVVASVAGGTAHACNESDVVAGGKILTLTISGPDHWSSDQNAFLLAVPTTDGMRGNLTVAAFSFSADMKVMSLTLPAFSAYTISADASYDMTLGADCFHTSEVGLTVTAAIVVTNGA